MEKMPGQSAHRQHVNHLMSKPCSVRFVHLLGGCQHGIEARVANDVRNN